MFTLSFKMKLEKFVQIARESWLETVQDIDKIIEKIKNNENKIKG